MKFLCRECDKAMKFKESEAPDQGSVTAIFECPDCFSEIAMYLNPWETQMLKSLDVQLGGKDGAAQPMQMIRSFLSEKKDKGVVADELVQSSAVAESSGSEEGGKCPFSSIVSEAFQEPEATDLVWTEEALERLNRIPTFIQSMAKAGIEEFAREEGHSEITGQVMDAARGNLGM